MNNFNTEIKNSEELKKNNDLFRSFLLSAKQKLYNNDLEGAYKDFSLCENIYGCAYCKFLQKELEEAQILLQPIKDSSPAVNWLLFLIGLIKDDITQTPTYFQIRNFYEQDMDLIIKYKNFDYVNKIFSNTNYFYTYNKEIYKYAAKVLFNNGFYDNALLCVKKSIDVYYNDPEIHYMYGEIYLREGNYAKAKEEFVKSNSVSGEYYPAIKKLKEILLT